MHHCLRWVVCGLFLFPVSASSVTFYVTVVQPFVGDTLEPSACYVQIEEQRNESAKRPVESSLECVLAVAQVESSRRFTKDQFCNPVRKRMAATVRTFLDLRKTTDTSNLAITNGWGEVTTFTYHESYKCPVPDIRMTLNWVFRDEDMKPSLWKREPERIPDPPHVPPAPRR